MDSAVRAAIEEHPVVDISTHERKSGATRSIEIRLWHADRRILLSGRPGKRSWYANLRANPQLTLHLKRGAEGAVEMTARGRSPTPASDARCSLTSRPSVNATAPRAAATSVLDGGRVAA
jgi:hypothetical protein